MNQINAFLLKLCLLPNLSLLLQHRISYNKISPFSLTFSEDLMNIQNIRGVPDKSFKLRPPNLAIDKNSNPLYLLSLTINCVFLNTLSRQQFNVMLNLAQASHVFWKLITCLQLLVSFPLKEKLSFRRQEEVLGLDKLDKPWSCLEIFG